jgi:hypothetical protein
VLELDYSFCYFGFFIVFTILSQKTETTWTLPETSVCLRSSRRYNSRASFTACPEFHPGLGTVIFKLRYAYPRWNARTSYINTNETQGELLNLEPALIFALTNIRPRIEALTCQKQAQSLLQARTTYFIKYLIVLILSC